jgi:hypothetical protein
VVLALSLEQQVERLLRAVPARVAVHREVAADDRADAADAVQPLLEASERLRSRLGQRVAPVGERVHDEVLDPGLPGDLHERLQVPVRRVHAAGRDEPDQVHARRILQRRLQHLVAGQRPVRDGLVDPREVLRHDRAGAEVEVADLGVAHLPLRQADGLALGGQRGVSVPGPQLVEHRRVGE